jgi:predicted nucleic acid-binding protein
LRYLLNDHPQHFELAQNLMKKVSAGEITAYIPDSVLAECVYVLAKVYKVPKIKMCVDSVIRYLRRVYRYIYVVSAGFWALSL